MAQDSTQGDNSTVELEPNEVALILGRDGTKMTVRIHAAEEPDEGEEVPEPFHVAVALAMRLIEDPEFHDEVLDWYEDHEEEGDDEEDDEGEGDEDDGDAEGDTQDGTDKKKG